MSTTIDQRVVEMRFDNTHFESNVKTSMSTLDKLKEKLNFKGAEKGFANISSAANKVDMNTLGKNVETVRAKFSALEVMGVTALANISNSAVNAGKNLVKSLSVDQIMSGWNKYEQKTASVQTIMNATGKSIDEVNQYLEKLMWFSDETSYGFTDMTAALGQMTSSGGDINKLIPLITGVANATAYAGKGASEFSRVMYNLNQSYGAGYLQLMDWKSLELAGVGSKQLKQTFIDTAEAMGKIKEGEVTIANFSQTLKDKWADTEVMEAAFGKFGEFSDAVHKLVNGDIEDFSKEIQDMYNAGEIETASDAIEALSGHYDELGTKAFKSAQEAKSFTEAIDATKDAVSSGWMKTFELIFGNYEQAKVLWTDLANTLWDLFASGGESRNALLEEALSMNPLSKFQEKLDKITETTQGAIDKIKDYGDVVNKILGGDFGNGQARWDKLTEAGYDWAHAQNLVNERLNDGTRHATEFNEVTEETTKQLSELTDEELRNLEFTEEEIKMFRELEKQAKKTGVPLNELIEDMDQMDGRTMLIDSFKNVGGSLVTIINAIKEAWSNVFPPMTALQLYNIIDALHEFSLKLSMGDETADKLRRTFEGLFATLDIILTIVGGPIKFAFKAVFDILQHFGLGVLDVTAGIGDAIVAFRDWIDSIFDCGKIFESFGKLFGGFDTGSLSKGFESLWSVLEKVAAGAKKCFDTFMSLPGVQKAIKSLGDAFSKAFGKMSDALGKIKFEDFLSSIDSAFDRLSKWIESLKDSENIGRDIIQGIIIGLQEGIGSIVDTMMNIGQIIIDTVCNVLGIHSPSTVMITIGKFIISGLILGLVGSKSGLFSSIDEITGAIKEKFGDLTNWLGNIKWPTITFDHIIAAGSIAGVVYTAKKFLDVVKMFGAGVEGFGKMCSGAGNLMNAFAAKINPKKSNWTDVANSVLKMSVSVGILAASVYALAQLDTKQLWHAVGAVAALAGVVVALAVAAKLVGGVDGSLGKLALTLIGVSLAVSTMASAMKKLTFLTEDNIGPVREGILLIGGILSACLLISKIKFNPTGMIGTLLGISVALFAMVGVIKTLGTMDVATIKQGYQCIVAFGLVIAGLMLINKIPGSGGSGGLGKILFGLSSAMIAMCTVIKIMGTMDIATIKQGYQCIIAFSIAIAALMLINKIPGGKSGGLAGMFIGVSMALLAMAACVKILGSMTESELDKAVPVIVMFGMVIAALIAVSKIPGGSGLLALAALLTSVSVLLAVMAGLVVVLGLVSEDTLKKGLGVVTALGLLLATLLAVSKLAQNCAGSIVAIGAVLAILVGSLWLLSKLDPGALREPMGALALLGGMLTLLLGISKLAQKSMGALLALSLVVATMGGVLYLLATQPIDQAVGAAAALSLFTAVMIGLLALLKLIKVDGGTVAGLLAITAMAVPLIAFVGVLSAMSGVENAKNSILSLTTMVTAMIALLVPLTIIGSFGTSALLGVASLAAMTVPLIAFVGVLAAMQNVENAKNNILSLTTMATAMTALLIPLTAIGAFGMAGLPFIGVLALTAMAVPLMTFVGVLALMQGIDIANDNVLVLTTLMTSLTNMLTAVSLLGPLALVGTVAVAAMTGTLTAIAGLVTALGAIFKIPGLQGLLDNGLAVLEGLASGLGRVIGGFINGLATSATEGLPEVASSLSEFMTNLQPFIDGVSDIDTSAMDGVKSLAGAFLSLTGSGLIHNLMSFFGADSGLEELGAKMVSFGKAVVQFSKTVSGNIDEGAVTAAANAGKVLCEMANNVPNEGGLLGWIMGNNDLATFSEKIVQFGNAIVQFSKTVAGNIDEGAVTAAANAGKVLCEMSNQIPNDGGVLGWIMGNNDLASFSQKIVQFGSAIVTFSKTVAGNIDESAVTAAANAGKVLCELSNQIPNDGGMLGWIVGNNDLADFGQKIVQFGSAMVAFSKTVAGNIDESAVTAAANAGMVFVALDEALPDEGGIKSWWSGGNTLEKFGATLVAFGEGIVAFSKTVAGNIDQTAMTSAAGAASSFIDIVNNLPESYDGLSDLGENMIIFAEQIVAFCEALKGIDTESFSQVASGMNDLSTSVANISNIDSDGITSFVDAIEELSSIDTSSLSTVFSGLATDTIDAFVNAFRGLGEAVGGTIASLADDLASTISSSLADPIAEGFTQGVNNSIESINNAITTLMTNMSSSLSVGFSSSIGAATTDVTNFVTNIATMIGNQTAMIVTAAEPVGAGIATGFQTGLSSSTSVATSAVSTFGSTISSSVSAIDVSGEAYTVGVDLVDGFIAGISDNISRAADKAAEMARNAVDAAEAELDINSPSKEFIKIGKSVGEGFVKGIDKGTDGVVKSAEAMANVILETERDALGIHSPSDETYNDGMNAAEGLVLGIEDGTKKVEKASEELANSVLDSTSPVEEAYEEGKNVAEAYAAGIEDGSEKKVTPISQFIELAKTPSPNAKKQVGIAVDENGKFDKIDYLSKFGKQPGGLLSVEFASQFENIFEYLEDMNSRGYDRTDIRTLLDKGLLDDVYKHFGLLSSKNNKSGKNAAKDKAQEIADMFSEELEKYDIASEIAENEFKLWKLENPKATDTQIDHKELDMYEKQYDAAKKASSVAKTKYLKFVEELGADANETDEAFKEWQEAKITEGEILQNMIAISERSLNNQRDMIDYEMDNRSKMHELWRLYNRDATDDEIETRAVGELNKNLADYMKRLDVDIIAYNEAVEHYGRESQEARDAYDKILEDEIAIAETKTAIAETRAAGIQNDIDDVADAIDLLEADKNLWLAKNKDATAEEIDAFNTEHLTQVIDKQNYKVGLAHQKLIQAIADYGEGSDEAIAAETEFIDEQTKLWEYKNEKWQIAIDAVERERELIEEYNNLMSEAADLNYQIWENTFGRDATSMEKNAAKVSMLSEQLQYQAIIMNQAKEEWMEASRDHTKTANEVQEAYNNYLNQQLTYARLQNEITDINEQTALRQKNAASEYKKYIDKYEKYYQMNGMTREDLERDAKLISGYDGNKTVDKILDSTVNALGKVTNSPEYKAAIEGFMNLGTSYVDAVNTGVNTTATIVTQSVTTMLDNCVQTINDDEQDWIDAGTKLVTGVSSSITNGIGNAVVAVRSLSNACLYTLGNETQGWVNMGSDLVSGFVSGIRANIESAAQAARDMARAASAAARSELDEHSPSREFAEIGMYAVMGFAKGISDNTDLSNTAASYLGSSAVDNLKETIKRLSDVVDADMDTQPTIRPVLDLTNVEAGTARLNSMFSRSQALRISAGMNKDNVSENQNGVNASSDGGNTYNFTQNNYSPKALSTTEIYRNTKNQFTAMKGALM